MKFLLLFFAVLPFIGFSQSSNKIKLSGQIQMVSYHQGGMMLPDEYKQPRPYGVKLFVIKFSEKNTKLVVVDSIQGNDFGAFEIQLEPGKYGFVTSAEKDNLKNGQFLPTSHSEQTEHTGSNSFWETNMQMPLSLKEEDVSGFTITYTNTSVCYTCP